MPCFVTLLRITLSAFRTIVALKTANGYNMQVGSLTRFSSKHEQKKSLQANENRTSFSRFCQFLLCIQSAVYSTPRSLIWDIRTTRTSSAPPIPAFLARRFLPLLQTSCAIKSSEAKFLRELNSARTQ